MKFSVQVVQAIKLEKIHNQTGGQTDMTENTQMEIKLFRYYVKYISPWQIKSVEQIFKSQSDNDTVQTVVKGHRICQKCREGNEGLNYCALDVFFPLVALFLNAS